MPADLDVSVDHEPIDLFTFKVKLGNDPRQVVVRRAASLPEMYLLQSIHGDDAVYDVLKEKTVTSLSRNDIHTELLNRYGTRAAAFFGRYSLRTLPVKTDKYPDRETEIEARRAAEEIRSGRASKKTASADPSDPSAPSAPKRGRKKAASEDTAQKEQKAQQEPPAETPDEAETTLSLDDVPASTE